MCLILRQICMREPPNIGFKPIIKLNIRLLIICEIVRVHVDLSFIDCCQLALCVHAPNICMDTAIIVKIIRVFLLHTFIIHFNVFIVFKVRIPQLAEDCVRLRSAASFHLNYK